MIKLKGLILLSSLMLLFSVGASSAQTRRQNASTPAASGQSAPPVAVTANTLAIVNNHPVTFEDLDPRVREAVSNLDKEVSEMRRRALTNQVNTLLFEAEAKKRGVTPEQLLNTEVYSRIPPPSEEEIKYIYDNNRDQLGTATLDEARPRIIAAVREQRAASLLEELATRLRMMYVVEWGATDVNAQGAQPSAVLATVAGRPVTLAGLNEQLRPAITDLRLRVYEAERQAVEAKINEVLLEGEARRRRVSRDDLIRTEVSAKVRRPTEAEVAKFYQENRPRIEGTLEARRAEIVTYLEQEERARLEQALVERLRSGASVRMLLAEPEGYVQKISADDDPARGIVNAPVTIVMFTDFQCPACAATHPVLEQVLKQYGERVRLVVRDFPLDQHQWARKAAEAAGAAQAQGKFFEYIAILYKNQQALDVDSLKRYAGELGMDRARFDRELDGGKYSAEVARDIADGKAYGIGATPTVFVNGVRLMDLSERAIKAGIDRAFERARQRPQAAAR